MSWHRPWKSALVNRRPARHTTPLRVERLEARDLPAAPVPAGIVSWYRAEGDASDFVGGNHGTLVNGATFTAGKVGQAFFFDGVDDQVSIPHDASLNPATQFTVEAWVNPRLNRGHGTADRREAVGPTRTAIRLRSHTRWPNAACNSLSLDRRLTAIPSQTPAGVVPMNTWQHVAATYDGRDGDSRFS